MAKYNPRLIRRQARHQGEIDGIHIYRVKSMTHCDGRAYEPVIDATTGEMSCTCPDWRYRGQKTSHPCKHLQQAIQQLQRKRLL